MNKKDKRPSELKKRHPKPERMCDLAHVADRQASTDVLGSYTGMAQGEEPPVQDADDL